MTYMNNDAYQETMSECADCGNITLDGVCIPCVTADVRARMEAQRASEASAR